MSSAALNMQANFRALSCTLDVPIEVDDSGIPPLDGGGTITVVTTIGPQVLVVVYTLIPFEERHELPLIPSDALFAYAMACDDASVDDVDAMKHFGWCWLAGDRWAFVRSLDDYIITSEAPSFEDCLRFTAGTSASQTRQPDTIQAGVTVGDA